MAEGGQLSLSSFKEQFDIELTCSVCLDQYTNPKILPCHHSFCLHCIKPPLLVEIKDGKYYISCPTCRVDHLLPEGGANSLPNDVLINSLLGLRKKLKTTKISIPTQSTCHKLKTITGFNNPHGIAVCDNGDIVVAELGANCITILNNKREKLKSFGFFYFPRGVAISIDGHILVTDSNRLQKLTTDGVCVKSIGSRENGCGQLQFESPSGIAVHPTTGQIFVADYGNNRIQVFYNDLTFSRTISPAPVSGQLSPTACPVHPPRDVAIDSEGYLYIVSDRRSWPYLGILKVSSSTGELIKRFSSPDQKVINPSSLTVHNGLLYVTECNKDTILVFNTEGKFQHMHTVSDIVSPFGISLDVFGNLNMTDFYQNRIVVHLI